MPQRTNPLDRTTIEVAVWVRDALKDYQTALQREVNRRATYDDIISALLWGVPLWQANAMMDSYRPAHGPIADPGSNGED